MAIKINSSATVRITKGGRTNMVSVEGSIRPTGNNWYVSSTYTGTTQNGRISTPWVNFTQIQSALSNGTIRPGDSVLFKRGETFPGTLSIYYSGTAGRPITFSSYGSGAKPIFIGTGVAIPHLVYCYGVNYIVFDGIDIIDITFPSDPTRIIVARIQRAMTFDNCNNCQVKNSEMTLVGLGIYFSNSSYGLIDSNTIHDLRMIVNTNDGIPPGNDDDFGAVPIWIAGNNNTITNNYCYGCWAQSYDYIYDGGSVEFFDEGIGASNNLIAYNTFTDNNGVSETSTSGNCNNNTFIYNKMVNNGGVFYLHTTATGWVFYNNVIIETSQPRISDVSVFGGRAAYTYELTLKNNVIILSTGIDVANASRFAPFVHDHNVYKLTNGSVAGYTLLSNEFPTILPLFTDETNVNPVLWNFTPLPGPILINNGIDVGLTRDFVGTPITLPPDIGIIEAV